MKIRLFGFGFLIFIFQFPVYAESFAESTQYYVLLKSAFRKVIPRETDPKCRDPLERLLESILRGSEGVADRDQVLEVARVTTLTSFAQELNGRLDGVRKALTQAERAIQDPKQDPRFLPRLKHQYFIARLTPRELAVVIHFYKNRDSKRLENSLVRNHGLLKKDTETARQAIEATAFPSVEIRWHGRKLPQVEYTNEMRVQWLEIGSFFNGLGLNHELLQIFSQLVNHEAGNLKYRHIRTFEERFLLAVRKLALEKGEHFQARDLLLAYLSNANSAKFLATHPSLFEADTEMASAKRNLESLGFFVVQFSDVRNRDTLAKFFEDGSLPARFQSPKSVQAQRIVHTYLLAAKEESSIAKETDSGSPCTKRLKVLNTHHMHELDNHLAKFRN